MATYPTLPTRSGSDPKPDTKLEIDRAEDGTARARSYGSDKMRIKLDHPYLSATDKSTLAAFYTTNRLIEFDYVSLSDGVTYSCLFAAPIEWSRVSRSRYSAKVEIVEA